MTGPLAYDARTIAANPDLVPLFQAPPEVTDWDTWDNDTEDDT